MIATGILPESDQGGAAPPGARERFGAIDVGSNSVRLLVAEYDPVAGISVIDEVKDQPRLAKGLAETGRLDDAAVERAMVALARMKTVCERRGVRRVAAVATSATREAENGGEFVRRVREELGIPLEIIDAHTEATLSWRSVAHHFQLDGARAVVADIGGGSLELIGAVDGLVEATASLPLGAVRTTETHIAGQRDVPKAIGSLRRHARRQLRKALPWREWTAPMLIGSGGTFTNLGRMAMARRGLPVPDSIHGTRVTTAEVEQLLEWLATRTAEQRRHVLGLNVERADIIVAGLAVTAELLDLADARELTVSAFGLREGLLLEMAGASPQLPSDPLRLLREFVERCQGDRRHVEHVRHLALLLFDELGGLLQCEPADRALLEAAGLVHDVGQLVSYRRHHRHSFQLIMHADRLPFAPRDRLLVALLSRYHRKSGPRKKHAEFAALSREDQALVCRLSALLRVADGLDRGHTGVVESVRVHVDADRVLLQAVPRTPEADLSLECWGATRKSELLQRLLDRNVVIETA